MVELRIIRVVIIIDFFAQISVCALPINLFRLYRFYARGMYVSYLEFSLKSTVIEQHGS